MHATTEPCRRPRGTQRCLVLFGRQAGAVHVAHSQDSATREQQLNAPLLCGAHPHDPLSAMQGRRATRILKVCESGAQATVDDLKFVEGQRESVRPCPC